MRWIVIVLSFAGCNSSSVNTLDDLYAQLVGALCQQEATCGAIGRSEVAGCTQRALAQLARPQAYDYNEAVASHRIALDGNQADTCIAALRGSTCNGLVDAIEAAACSHIFTPLVQPGGACRNSAECIGGFCTGMTSGCAGTCTAFAATGASCMTTNCASTDACTGNPPLCVARGGNGAACSSSSLCQTGLSCLVANGATTGTCAERGGVGTACGTSYDCAQGLFCNTYGNAMATCQAAAAAGASCPGLDSCVDGQLCVGGTCHAFLDVGSSCDPTQPACPADAPCDATLHACTLPPQAAAGDACMPNNNACRSTSIFVGQTLYCSPSKQCENTIDLGQACTPPVAGAENPCFTGNCDPTTKVCATQCM